MDGFKMMHDLEVDTYRMPLLKNVQKNKENDV